MKKIPLTRNKVALVDDEDFIVLSNLKWYCLSFKCGIYYAATYINKKQVTMHQFLINAPTGYEVDHKDGNSLNNQKINLRVCLHYQNMANRKMSKHNKTGFKGVSFSRARKQYRADIQFNGKNHFLGLFYNKEDAAKAYDRSAIENFGEFAKTNYDLGLLL